MGSQAADLPRLGEDQSTIRRRSRDVVLMRSGLARLRNQGSPVPYAPRAVVRQSLLPGPGGAEAYLKALGANGTLWQIVHLLSAGSARPEWRMFRKTQDMRVRYSTTDTGSDQRTEVLQHQALS